MIMAKIILKNGVINVEESFSEIEQLLPKYDWICLNEYVSEVRHMDKLTGKIGDYRIVINVKHIQCIKP